MIHKGPNIDDLKLCYIEGDSVAFFTTQDLDQQIGDDWNDRPYEHNAGRPYTPTAGFNYHTGDEPPWYIMQLMFESWLIPPSENHFNSPYCVYDINREKKIAWLRSEAWLQQSIEIWAGEGIADFVRKIFQAEGRVFWPITQPSLSAFTLRETFNYLRMRNDE